MSSQRRVDLESLGYRLVERWVDAVSILDDGDYTIIPAPGAGRRIRVTGIHLTADGNTKLRLQEPSESLSGPYDLTSGVPLNIDQPNGILVSNENLAIELSSSGNGVIVGGSVTWEVWELVD